MSRVIGLYGGSGAGKSSAARWFKEHGALVIDADEVSREVSAPAGSASRELREAFPDCFSPDGKLDRRALGARVFTDAAVRKQLEGIVHPHMRRRIEEILANAAEDLIVLDCAILLQPAFRDLADERWLVTAPASVRRTRIEQRDQLPRERAQERIDAQMPEEDLRREADRIIENSGSEMELFEKLAHEIAE